MQGEKNWQDMGTEDLERAMVDQHDRPLGTFVGDGGVKEREGHEDEVRSPSPALPAPVLRATLTPCPCAQYLGGSTAFGGGGARQQRFEFEGGGAARAPQQRLEVEDGDIGRAYGRPEDEAY